MRSSMLMRGSVALVAVFGAVGCGAATPPAREPDGAAILGACTELHPSEDVSSWECGHGVTAVEAFVNSASEREISIAFDEFAQSFGVAGARRVDSLYTSGNTRNLAVRIDADAASGEFLDAQMVAVTMGRGVRLVTCSSRDRAAPCSPLIAALVQGPKRSTLVPTPSQPTATASGDAGSW
ncbi:MAG: hypothetical protein U0271_29790 [Polyangiaceae bacterium]